MTYNIWVILGIVAVVLLVFYWWGKNAVWGYMTLGAIVGLLIAIIFMFKGNGFDWLIIGKSAIIGTLFGFISECYWKLSDLIRRDTNN